MKTVLQHPVRRQAAQQSHSLGRALDDAGRPLPEEIQTRLEMEFAADFSRVRIHTDSHAADAAAELDAEAITFGQHILFAAGAWRPETRSGWDLLVHEAAHTLQQSSTSTLDQARISEPGEQLEREADRAVQQSSRGEQIIAPSLNPDVVVARRLAGMEPRRDATVDPARIVEETARSLMRAIRTDARDRDGRVRQQLIRMQDRLKRDVLRWLERNLQSQEWRQLVEVLAEPLPPGVEGVEDRESAASESPTTAEVSATEEATAEATTATPEEAELGAAVEDEREEEAVPETEGTPAEPEGEAVAEGEGEVAHPEVQGGETTEEGMVPDEAVAALPIAGEEAAPAVPEAATAAPPMQEGAVASPAAGPAVEEQQEQEAIGTETELEESQSSEGAGSDETVAAAAPVADEETAPAVSEAATAAPPMEEGAVAGPMAGPVVEEQREAESTTAAMEPEQEQAPEAAAPDLEAGGGNGEGSVEVPEQAGEGAGFGEAREPVADMAPPAMPQSEPPELVGASSPQLVSAVAASTQPTMHAMAPSALSPATAPVMALAAPATVEEPELLAPAPLAEPTGAASTSESETAAVEAPSVGEFSGEPPAETDGGCSGGAGGGGGGAGGATPETTAEAPADMSQDNPVDAMQSVSTMDAGQAAESIGGASEAVCGQAEAQRERLTSELPSVERPSGSPVDEEGTEPGAVDFSPAGPDPEPMAEAPEPVESSTPEPLGAPDPGAPVTQSLAAPRVTGTGEGQITEADAARIQQAVRNVPVTDESLNVTAGPAPTLMLEGDADPAYAEQQQTELLDTAGSAHDQGLQDASAPMGEDQIYPATEPGTLTAEQTGSGCGGGGCGGHGGGTTDPATAAVAEEERGDEIRQAAAGATGDLVSEQEAQATEEQEANDQTQEDIQTAIDENAQQQSNERRRARHEVNESRQEWADEQQGAVDSASRESTTAVGGARRDVQAQRTTAEREAGQHVQTGNREIGDARRNAETEARAERADAQREADNSVLGWLSSAITSFFSRLREAIHAVFDAARRLVREAIETAQRLAHEVIDAARRAVVALIRAAGEALIAIGDRLLAAFPTLRERFRNAIQSVVDAAVEAVNRLAELLEEGILALLNALGAVLNGILCAYERLYMAIVDAVANAIQGAINFARTVIAGFGAFAELVGDIAENPGQWVSNLGASVIDGVRNHLWCALKTAVRNWFNQTVEGIVGMGRMLLDVLRRGGLTIARIGGFVWNAILSALPSIIIGFLIERLVALLIPGAGAIIAVIQALIAAWGTIQQIVQAFQMFFTFLRAVKNGGAGPQFAAAVAASAVVVIQFMAMFLLSRIARAAGSVIGRLRSVAQRLMAFFRRAARAVRRGMRAVGRAVRRGMRAMGRAMRRVGRALRRRLARTRFGRGLLRRVRRVRARLRRRRARRRRDRRRNAQERLERAMSRIRPALTAMTRRGAPRLLISARLLVWRALYGLTELSLRRNGDRITIRARVNPGDEVSLSTLDDMTISEAVFRATERYINETPEVIEASERIGESPFRENLQTGEEGDPVIVPSGIGIPAMVRAFRRRRLTPRALLRGRPIEESRRHMSHGAGSSASTIFEQAPARGATVSNQFTMLPIGRSRPEDPIQGLPLHYSQVTMRLETISRISGEDPAWLANHLRVFIRTGNLPTHLQNHRSIFAYLSGLMFVREGVRYTPALAHGAMAIESMSFGPELGGFATPAQVFGTETSPGALPMAMTRQEREQSTPAAARALERRHRNMILYGRDRRAGRGDRPRELARREAALVRQWMRTTLQIEDRIYPSREAARADIERLVLELLDRYFRTRTMRVGV